jgi:hypothetical protein
VNQSTTVHEPVQAKLCHCGRPVYFSTETCKRCRERQRRRRVAVCKGCGKEKRIACRGCCSNCYDRLPRGSGESRRPRHEETPKELAAAKALEPFFVKHVLPTVRSHAYRIFHSLNFQERQEVVQESIAVCWRLFVRLVGSGRDPADYVVRLAWLAVKEIRRWQYLAGAVSSFDVLSRRVAVHGLVRILSGDGRGPDGSRRPLWDRVGRPDLDPARREWLSRLDPKDRELVLFLEHNSVRETQAQFGLRKRDLEALYDRLWAHARR